jgi:replicative DNA helicase
MAGEEEATMAHPSSTDQRRRNVPSLDDMCTGQVLTRLHIADRLPTLSVAAALAGQLDTESNGFRSGSEALDRAIGGHGLQKGKLLEVCGPPGSGKTAIAYGCRLNTKWSKETGS